MPSLVKGDNIRSRPNAGMFMQVTAGLGFNGLKFPRRRDALWES